MRLLPFATVAFAISVLASAARADQLPFQMCWHQSGVGHDDCQNSTADGGGQTVLVDFHGLASFHFIALKNISPNAVIDFTYHCLFEKNGDTGNGDLNASKGADCPPFFAQYVKNISVKLAGAGADRVILRYRCKVSKFGSSDQWNDPSDGSWISDQTRSCGPTDDRNWISRFEISTFVIPVFP